MSIELKPCPFCGGSDFEIVENGRIWSGMKYSEPVSVGVRHWCPATPGQPSRMIERVGRDEASAVTAWNTRHTLSQHPATGEPIKLHKECATMPNDERCDECQQPATPEPMQADSSEHLRVVASLGDALRRLSFAAQTTGGTTGPDAELQSAIGQAEQALSLGGIWQAMSATTEPVEDGIRNAEDELNCAEEVLDAITCEFSDGEFPVTDFNCIGDYITAVVDVFKERLAAQQPATTEPVASRNPFASRCYAMSESHLSGHRLIVGFEKLGDVQDAHEWVARQGRGDFTHPATGEPVGQVSDLFPSVRNKLHAKGFDSDAPLYTHPAPSVPAWAQDVVIEYRYTGGTHWCPLGPAERVKAGFDGVYRLKPGSFPTETPAPSAPDDVVRDAGRYRWLRNSLPAGQGSLTVILDDRCNGCFNKLVFMESLDVAIDAAMLAAAQAQKGGA